ncbi:MAG: KilA-N domain-containing protein [Rhodoferax sp.]|nr:KilA-N domain-containing protein [Rhodoferax sp.]
MKNHQLSLSLISHRVQDSIIEQRAEDGYINATAMCKAAGKQMNDYTRLDSTKAFLAELSVDTGIPVSQLIQVLKEGWKGQGTWAHPHVSTHLAQWLSPKFAVQVSKWVHEWLSGKRTPAKLPYHLERHMINFHKIPSGYFSVLQEMTNRLVAPMEAHGYRLPDNMMPDIAQAKLLCKMLRDKYGIDTNALEKYTHTFPDGREVLANLYPVKYLGEFHVLMAEEWLPNKAPEYFRKRDPLALQALDKMLLLTASMRPNLKLVR